ncbi:DUF4097 domain-containing protein [Bacillus sp. JCM 19034]|uniref:DUF4097 domain-containing protein n=1 Tax=Bacillus sp. JCM 19034 TaxID=1481928 RepID=UPI000784997B|nr:DUF4097 domain-containing protein [Bacillus sp. JCM 19034]
MKYILGIGLIVVGIIIAYSAIGPIWLTGERNEVGDYLQESLDEVTHLELSGVAIDWEIETSNHSYVEIEIDNKHKRTNMYSTLKNGTLSIEIKRENFFSFIPFNFSFSQEKAIVRIPQDYMDALTIDSVSGDVLINDLSNLQSISVKTVSGDLIADLVEVETNVQLNTTSGDMLLQNVKAEEISVDTVSGDVAIPSIEGEISVKTTSGDIYAKFNNDHNAIMLKTTSGDVMIDLANANAELDLNTTSGDILVTPTMSDQQVSNRQISGKIGQGEYPISVTTTSGDILIK